MNFILPSDEAQRLATKEISWLKHTFTDMTQEKTAVYKIKPILWSNSYISTLHIRPEAGRGVGAQTVTLAGNSPNASFISIDIKASKTYTEQQKPTAFFVIRFSRRLQPRSEMLNKAVENRVRGSAYD